MYLGVVYRSNLFDSVEVVFFKGERKHSVYNEADCMLHNRLLSLSDKYF